jgi:CBS domain-containing protein
VVTRLIGIIIGGTATFFGSIALWLSSINFALAIFNLLPGFPLDGGRLLRGIVWWRTKDMLRATRIAAGAGQTLAIIMILGGLLAFFRPQGDFGGLWIALLGWFLLEAARASVKQVEMENLLRGATAADLMTNDCPIISADYLLSQFVDEYLLRTGRRCFLAADSERFLGIITPRDLQKADRAHWSDLTVADVMSPFSQLSYVTPETTADRVLTLMGNEEVNQLPVVSDGRLLGIITREHIIRFLTTQRELAESAPTRPLAHPHSQTSALSKSSTRDRAA